MDHVTSLQSQLQEMSHREEDAYQQMKKGIQLVEQSQLEHVFSTCQIFSNMKSVRKSRIPGRTVLARTLFNQVLGTFPS